MGSSIGQVNPQITNYFNNYIYPVLFLFEQSNYIDWINFCYIQSLTKV